jgi:hypothetical protein
MILLAIALLGPGPAPAENWQVLTDADNGVVFWIDRDSIRDTGTYKQARTKSDYHAVTWGDVDHRVVVEDYDCARRALRARSSTAYGRDGNVLRSATFTEDETSWTVVDPGSIADAKIEAVCGTKP